jgi:hypothetical protein
LLSSEKLTAPGRLSKNVPPAGATVNDTGTVLVTPPNCDVKTICPVYVPAVSVWFAFTTTRRLCGVPQVVQPLKLTVVTDSQFPPVVVVAAYVKLKFVPALVTVTVCGSGFAPLKTLVKDSGPIGENCCASSEAVDAAASNNADATKANTDDVRFRDVDVTKYIVSSDTFHNRSAKAQQLFFSLLQPTPCRRFGPKRFIRYFAKAGATRTLLAEFFFGASWWAS